MIIINCGPMQDKIIEAIGNIENEYAITFVKKQAVKMYFESNNDDEAAKLIKTTLKADPKFSALYLTVNVE